MLHGGPYELIKFIVSVDINKLQDLGFRNQFSVDAAVVFLSDT